MDAAGIAAVMAAPAPAAIVKEEFIPLQVPAGPKLKKATSRQPRGGTVPPEVMEQYKLLNDRAIGVSQMGKKWATFVTLDKKSRYIGSFGTIGDAAWAYDCVIRFMKFDRATNYIPTGEPPSEVSQIVYAKRECDIRTCVVQ